MRAAGLCAIVLLAAGVAAGQKAPTPDLLPSDIRIRFQTADSPEKVAAWYRDPARSDGFRLTSETHNGSFYVFNGIERHDQHPFKVSFGPGSGGTEGRLHVHHDD